MNKITHKLRRWRIPILSTVIGGIGGWLYYRYVGCLTGTCPIASNPYLMPVYGSAIGFLLGYALHPRRNQDAPDE